MPVPVPVLNEDNISYFLFQHLSQPNLETTIVMAEEEQANWGGRWYVHYEEDASILPIGLIDICSHLRVRSILSKAFDYLNVKGKIDWSSYKTLLPGLAPADPSGFVPHRKVIEVYHDQAAVLADIIYLGPNYISTVTFVITTVDS